MLPNAFKPKTFVEKRDREITESIAPSLKWDRRFMELAFLVSTWSKDPSTQCGAVIVRPDKSVASMGFNGFPRGMPDDEELYEDREEKYKRVIHCEINAVLQAKEPVKGYTLYCYPFLTCDRCSVHIIQAGIIRVVAPRCPADKAERWEEAFTRARKYYKEASVTVHERKF